MKLTSKSVQNIFMRCLRLFRYIFMMEDGNSLMLKYLLIFKVVASYWIVSLAAIFMNKNLLSDLSSELDVPVFIVWFQCLVSSCIYFLISNCKKMGVKIKFPEASPFSIDLMKKVLPCTFLFVAMMSFNNMCLQNLDVAFYQIARSLTTVFNIILAYLILGQTTSVWCSACCFFIVIGFWIGVDQELSYESFSLYGTVFGVLGSLSQSLFSIYTTTTLKELGEQVLILTYCVNVYSIVLCLPKIYFSDELDSLINSGLAQNPIFWYKMILSGMFAFSVGILSVLQIQITSPLTHIISGTSKSCVQTIIAVHWYQETKSLIWWFSNIFILLSSALYTRFKQIEMKQLHTPPEKIKEKETVV